MLVDIQVHSKEYVVGELDEGKCVLLDPTKDTALKMRVSNNLMVWNGIVNILMKTNPNMEVYGNSILSDADRSFPAPNGITCNSDMPNLVLYDNAVYGGSAGEQGASSITPHATN